LLLDYEIARVLKTELNKIEKRLEESNAEEHSKQFKAYIDEKIDILQTQLFELKLGGKKPSIQSGVDEEKSDLDDLFSYDNSVIEEKAINKVELE